MARPQLLLVDADPRNVRVLEASLKSDGFSVTSAADGAEALEKLRLGLPDVMIADTRLPRLNGFELCRELNALPGGEDVPVVLIAPERSPDHDQAQDDLVRAAEYGVENCLRRPILVRELVVRVRLLLARRQQARIVAAGEHEEVQFSGRLQDTSMVDLLLSLDSSRQSGRLRLAQGGRTATLLFRNGKVVDAEQGRVQGEEAVYRTLLWSSGLFDFESCEVRQPDVIPTGLQGLLTEGMRRIEEWGRLAEQLPSIAAVFDVDAAAILERLPEIPDELNAILSLVDGARTLIEIVDVSPFDDLSTLSVISKLYFDGVLFLVEDKSEARALLPGGTSATGSEGALTKTGEPSIRPVAPSLSAESVPRHLMYSEPPRSQRWSQRPAASTKNQAASRRDSQTPGPAAPRLKGTGVSTAKANEPVRPVIDEPVNAPQRAEQVVEAEFEDVSPQSVSPPVVSPSVVSPSAVSPDEPARSPAAAAEPPPVASPVTSGAVKGPPDHLEHSFFAEGEEGTYEGGPASVQPSPTVAAAPVEEAAVDEVDPALLAMVTKRRQNSRRWVARIVGVAVLLSLWGLFALWRQDDEVTEVAPEYESEPAVSGAAAPPVVAPEPPVDTETAAPTALDEAPGFEQVLEETPASPNPGEASRTAVGASKPPGQSAFSNPGGQKRSATPSEGRRDRKPPTARFPSTQEAK